MHVREEYGNVDATNFGFCDILPGSTDSESNEVFIHFCMGCSIYTPITRGKHS